MLQKYHPTDFFSLYLFHSVTIITMIMLENLITAKLFRSLSIYNY